MRDDGYGFLSRRCSESTPALKRSHKCSLGGCKSAWGFWLVGTKILGAGVDRESVRIVDVYVWLRVFNTSISRAYESPTMLS